MLGEEKLIVMADDQRARRKDPTPDLKPHTDATSVTEIVSLKLACLVTGDAAQAKLAVWTDLPMVDPN